MKKFAFSGLILALVSMVFISCGSRPKGSEIVVSQFLNELKAINLKQETLAQYIDNYSDQLDTFNRIASMNDFEEAKPFYSIYFSNMSYKFLSQEPSEAGTVVKTQIRNVGSDSFMERFMKEVLNKYLDTTLGNLEKYSNASEEERKTLSQDSDKYLKTLISDFKIQESDFVTNEYNFLVKKDEQGKDKIVLNDKMEGDRLVSLFMPRPKTENGVSGHENDSHEGHSHEQQEKEGKDIKEEPKAPAANDSQPKESISKPETKQEQPKK